MVTPGDKYRKLPFKSAALSVTSLKLKHLAVMLKDNPRQASRNTKKK
jgi:hypothetical protein